MTPEQVEASTALVPSATTDIATRDTRVPGGPLPPMVMAVGRPAVTAWDDFFAGKLANAHTRLAYERAVRAFLV